jgi:hypothetical protein
MMGSVATVETIGFFLARRLLVGAKPMNDMCVSRENFAANVHLLNGRRTTPTYPKAPMIAQSEMLLSVRHWRKRLKQRQREVLCGQGVNGDQKRGCR